MSEQYRDRKDYEGEINSVDTRRSGSQDTSDSSFSDGFFEMRKEEIEKA